MCWPGHTAQPRFNAILLGLFAGVGVPLAAAGVFGGAAAWGEQRTREIGVRMALGAQKRDGLVMGLNQALLVAGAGVSAGVRGTLADTRLLQTCCLESPRAIGRYWPVW